MPDDVIKSLEKAKPFKWPADKAEPQKEEATSKTAAPQPLPLEEALRQAEIENRIGDDADGSTKSAGATVTGHAPADQDEASGSSQAFGWDDEIMPSGQIIKGDQPQITEPSAGTPADDGTGTRGKRTGLTFPRFLTADEFCADQKAPPYIIKRHVPRHTLTMVFGQPASGKTFYMLDQALSVAAGLETWHGIKLRQGTVLYVTGEARTGLKKRIAAWAKEHDRELSSFPDFHTEYVQVMNLNDGHQVADFLDCIEEQGLHPDWIILDTLFRFMTGDENKVEDAQSVITGCHEIMNRFDCALTLVHHQGVSQEAKEQKRPRGSSAFLGALDVVTIVEKDGKQVDAEQTKNKDDDTTEMHFIMDSVKLDGWLDDDNQPVYSAVLRTSKETADTGGKKVSEKNQPHMNTLVKCLEDGRGEVTKTTGKLAGVLHTVWRDFYCDPRTNPEVTGAANAKATRFEDTINVLLKRGNIEISNNDELHDKAEDRDRRLYLPKGKEYVQHFDEWAEATRKRQAAAGPDQGESPQAEQSSLDFSDVRQALKSSKKKGKN